MPKLDKTGPTGQGSMTGQGDGLCNKKTSLCSSRCLFCGRFKRGRCFANMSLEQQKEMLERELKSIDDKIKENNK